QPSLNQFRENAVKTCCRELMLCHQSVVVQTLSNILENFPCVDSYLGHFQTWLSREQSRMWHMPHIWHGIMRRSCHFDDLWPLASCHMVPLTPKRLPYVSQMLRQIQNRCHVAEKAFYLAVFSVSLRTPVGQTE